jgi:hypothetical protein
VSKQLSVTAAFILGRAQHAHRVGATQRDFLKRLDNQATANSTERLVHLSAALDEAIGNPSWPWM